MKKRLYKLFLVVITTGLLVSSCDLTEHPTFLSQESAYDGIINMKASLDGIYNGLTRYDYYSNDFVAASLIGSGNFVSGNGNSNQHPDNANLASLKPQASSVYVEKPWEGMYRTIDRANAFIQYVKEVENPKTNDELLQNDLLGEAYFLRALTYFNLVQLYGSVPLRLEPTTPENIHMAKSPTDVIYNQIISDAKNAERLMFPVPLNRKGYPASEAASMLLAKVYMRMATTDDAVPETDEMMNWQKAYEYAKKVYGKYSLVDNYNDLFDPNIDNTTESIFEIQYNEIVHSNHQRLFTPNNAVVAQTWGRVRANAEVIDLFMNCYPADTIRLNSTFKWVYMDKTDQHLKKVYPAVNRNNFYKSFPYIYKFWLKDKYQTTPYTQKNFVVYRYADLLLMLAEISNELQNGEQNGYVNEVLGRVGLSINDFVPDPITGADYMGGQEAFRKAITLEYRFELLAEAQDYFNNRRRGFQFFKEMVIEPHNNYEKFKSNIDVVLQSDNPDLAMHFPIPQSEINTNDLIDN